MEKPISDITANVPMMDTKIEIVGISVDLMSCKNTYTTTMTKSIASSTSCISLMVLDAFEPDFWFIIIMAAGCPFTSDE